MLALAMLAALGAPTPASAAESKTFGVSEPNTVSVPPLYPTADGLASQIADLGAGGHRWLLDWQRVEPQAPQNGAHSYLFARYDRLYAADLANGVRPLIVVTDAPRWALDPVAAAAQQPHGMPPGSDHLDDWSDFIRAAARRYPQALAFEIWNEPNAWAFWGRKVLPIDPAAYTRVLKEAHAAIKAENPAMPVVAGGMSAYSYSKPGVHLSVAEFVDGMLRAGAAGAMDGIGLHPYANGPNPPGNGVYEQQVDLLRSALRRGGVQVPIWITETGISTTGPTAVSEAGQAQTLLDLYRWFGDQPDLRAFFIHSLTERWTNPSSREVGFGLIRFGAAALEPKPAYTVLREAARADLSVDPPGPLPEPPGPLPVPPGPLPDPPGGDSAAPSADPAPPPSDPGPAAEYRGLVVTIPGHQAVARRGGLRAVARCAHWCRVEGGGVLKLRTRAGWARWSLRGDSSVVAAGRTARLVLGLRPKHRRTLRTLSRRHPRALRATVTIVARDGQGRATKRTIRARFGR